MPTLNRAHVMAIIGLVVVALLALAVANDLTDAIDRAAFEAIRTPSLAGLLAPLRVVTELGSTWAVTVVAGLTMVVGLLIGPWLHGAAGAITIGLASLGVEAVKGSVARDRPEVLDPIVVERGFSFPSGHATLSMVAYGILAVLITRSRLPRHVRTAGVVLIAVLLVGIGVSRVWLGVHFPTDVLAGWTTGAVIVLLFATFTRPASREPAVVAVDADPAEPRSDPPGSD